MSLKLSLLLFLAFTISHILCEESVDFHSIEKQILDQILDKSKYDSRIVPTRYNETTRVWERAVVSTNFYVRSIEYISTENMEWKVQLTFRHQWNDPRLVFDDKRGKIKYLGQEKEDNLWTPDTFISNSRTTKRLSDLKPNSLVRIYPNGNVLFSTRLTTTLSCPMNLKYYPFDQQICAIQLASYGYTTDNVELQWKQDDPVQVTKLVATKEFTLEKYMTDECTARTNTGEYSCLKASFAFRRNPSGYLGQWFAPTAVLTFLSFVSFWLRPNKSIRIKLLIITLVLLYLHIIYINNKSSLNVSYKTAKDCWLTTCLAFVLAAFVEYGIIKIVDKFSRSDKSSMDSLDYQSDKKLIKSEETDVENANTKGFVHRKYVQNWRQSTIGRRIDYLSAIVFPLIFTVHIIYYFYSISSISNLSTDLWENYKEYVNHY